MSTLALVMTTHWLCILTNCFCVNELCCLNLAQSDLATFKTDLLFERVLPVSRSFWSSSDRVLSQGASASVHKC